jgi:hypothetical protein
MVMHTIINAKTREGVGCTEESSIAYYLEPREVFPAEEKSKLRSEG